MLLGIAHINISSPWTRFNTTREIKTYIPELIRHNHDLYVGSLQGLFYLPQHTINHGHDSNTFLHVSGTNHNCFAMLSLDGYFLAANNDKLCLIRNAQKAGCVTVQKNRNIYDIAWSKKFPGYVIVSVVEKGLWWVRLSGSTAIPLGRKQRENHASVSWIEGFGPLHNEALSNGYFTHLSIDTKGDIWASSQTDGIFWIEFLGSNVWDVQVSRYGVRHGLPSLENHKALWIRNRLLVATDQGVYRLKNTEKLHDREARFELDPSFSDHPGGVWELHPYGKDLVADTQNGAGIWRANPDGSYTWDDIAFRMIPTTGRNFKKWLVEENGVIWVSNNNDVLRFDPGVEKSYRVDYRPIIRSVTIKGGKQIFGGFYYKEPLKGEREAAVSLTDKQPEWMIPRLSYDENSITFEYGVPFYDQPSGNQAAVMLEGFENDWNPWSSAGKKEYTNLPEGSYRFVVRARNCYGHESKTSYYGFVVFPPWYRTSVAYVTYVVFFFLFVYASIRINGRRLLAAKKRLENIVRQRTETIREQNDQLHNKNKEISQAYIQLKNTQNQLLDASWKAGMADVASNVLHNVGNALCSVNVSKNLIREKMGRSKIQ